VTRGRILLLVLLLLAGSTFYWFYIADRDVASYGGVLIGVPMESAADALREDGFLPVEAGADLCSVDGTAFTRPERPAQVITLYPDEECQVGRIRRNDTGAAG
jgi:hypothetical protein